jgi:beta-fructofuranosidase
LALYFDDKRVWDFWFAQDGIDTHLFYLQADRSPGDGYWKYWQASIGHAVSQDLRRWQILPSALSPAPYTNGSSLEPFDNFSLRAGSIVRHEGLWYLFYTGCRFSERGQIQRIGLATSPDLIEWQKHPNNPVMTAADTWYELFDLGDWFEQVWRDPHVFRDPVTGLFHSFIAARRRDGDLYGRGVVAHAYSYDLVRWVVSSPITDGGDFGCMENLQMVQIEGRSYLVFSCPDVFYSPDYQNRLDERHVVTGTRYLMADHPFGVYHAPEDNLLVGDRAGTLYGGKIIQDALGHWQLLACHSEGGITDPMPVVVDASGALHVQR